MINQPGANLQLDSLTDESPNDETVLSSLPNSMIERLRKAEEILRYSFNDKRLVLQAITHPSALENPFLYQSYERLEFLGDAYLGAIISELLYSEFPDLDEGGMTRMKIALVSGDTLSAKAAALGMADIIIFGSAERGTGKRGLHSALENVFEALIAAMALDGGIEVAKKWVIETLGDTVSIDMADRPDNPKSQLQELLQVRQVTPTYQLVSTEGPAHNRMFTAVVLAEGKVLAQGTGRSIKEAEVAAAALALEQMGKR
ncbi:MAG: ribonuclease III [Coriobacteriia bacterium]|nr:ribonuclease III [Coriobacteriia bacterium]